MSSNGEVKSVKKFKILDMVYIAIGAVLITICSWINIPTAVPFTLQTFAVFFILMLLGGERGTISILIYILLGAVGVPVFAGFSGGIGILFGNTGGYILGFIFIGLIYILFTRVFKKKSVFISIAAFVIGLAICYVFGTAWFMYLYTKASGKVGLFAVLGWCVFPFIIPDLIKMAFAVLIAKRMAPVLKLGDGVH